MKAVVTSVLETPVFQPVVIELHIETERELQALRALGGSVHDAGTGLTAFHRQYGNGVELRDSAVCSIVEISKAAARALIERGIQCIMPY